MSPIQAAVRVQDRVLIELDQTIVRTAHIRNGALFEEVLTEQGVLLKRADMEDAKEDVGPTQARTSPTAHPIGGTKN